jgi:ArsR family transcriptional regulator
MRPRMVRAADKERMVAMSQLRRHAYALERIYLLMKDAVAILSVLAEPTRLAALRMLRDGREHCVCELMEALNATQSRMSRHMAALRDAGLVVDRRDAQWVRYRLHPALPERVRRLLDAALDLTDVAERRAA